MSSASTAHKFEITRHVLVMNLFVRCSCGTPHGPFLISNTEILWYYGRSLWYTVAQL